MSKCTTYRTVYKISDSWRSSRPCSWSILSFRPTVYSICHCLHTCLQVVVKKLKHYSFSSIFTLIYNTIKIETESVEDDVLDDDSNNNRKLFTTISSTVNRFISVRLRRNCYQPRTRNSWQLYRPCCGSAASFLLQDFNRDGCVKKTSCQMVFCQ